MTNKKLKGGLTNLKDLKVGFLLVLRKKQYVKVGKRPEWYCRCTAPNCDREIVVAHNRLIHKENPKTHCGCQTAGGLPKQFPREYHTWWDAKSRCHNPDHPAYPSYGAKGIFMCEQWRESFEQFLKDVGPRPEGMSLDRIDPFGPYAPEHNGKPQVRWADRKTQDRNKKGTKWVLHPSTGKPIQAAALAEELGISYQKLRQDMIDNGTWDKKVERPDDV